MYNLSTLYLYIDMGSDYVNQFLCGAALCSNIIIDCDINNTIISIFLYFFLIGVASKGSFLCVANVDSWWL